jgi:hypothetical protein
MKDTKMVPRSFLRGRVDDLRRLEADIRSAALSRRVSDDACVILMLDGIAAHVRNISEALADSSEVMAEQAPA